MGIDVFSGDGKIDWQLVKDAGHSFGIAKASQGLVHVDWRFGENYRGMVAAGMVPGAYHYLTSTDPVMQAYSFIDAMNNVGYDLDTSLPPAVDVEDDSLRTLPYINKHIDKFLQVVDKYAGRKCLFYADLSFLEEEKIDGFSGHPLWLARWGGSPPSKLPGGWKEWKIWQYTSTGTIKGVGNSTIDLNHYPGTETDMRNWLQTK